jgi:hypothetical protein
VQVNLSLLGRITHDRLVVPYLSDFNPSITTYGLGAQESISAANIAKPCKCGARFDCFPMNISNHLSPMLILPDLTFVKLFLRSDNKL